MNELKELARNGWVISIVWREKKHRYYVSAFHRTNNHTSIKADSHALSEATLELHKSATRLMENE